MAATRDVPPDRLNTLRVGYHSSLKDPALRRVEEKTLGGGFD
jgi:hypothetical protein